MKTLRLILLLLTFRTYLCSDVNKLFESINKDYEKINAIGASISWLSSVEPGNPEIEIRSQKYQRNLLIWLQSTCDRLAILDKQQLLNDTQIRQTYLLCRGPKFTYEEARLLSNLYEELQSIYSNAEVCIPVEEHISSSNLSVTENAIVNYLTSVKELYKIKTTDNVPLAAEIAVNQQNENGFVCIKGEEEFQSLMDFSRNEAVLRWLWLVWRMKVGPPMRRPYKILVEVENRAAKRNGYRDIGESWREELEIPNLRQLCKRLYNDVLPLYKTLHGVVRYFLRKQYGNIVPKNGPIPAHLLGNMWAENWDPLMDLILKDNINWDGIIKGKNWTVLHMAKRAEDYYQSLGLPAMTDTFWRKSIFNREDHRNARCHGTAADMFKEGDFRLLYCANVSMDNFYVLHHEMGHIQYFMAYEHQPAVFRQANKAFHETIGDTIMLGVMTPQHLHRLGLINDTVLYETNKSNLLLKLEDMENDPRSVSNEEINREDMNTYLNNDLELKINKDSIQIKTNDKEYEIYHPNLLTSQNTDLRMYAKQDNIQKSDSFNIYKYALNHNIFPTHSKTHMLNAEDFMMTNKNENQKQDDRTSNWKDKNNGKDDVQITKISLEDAILLKQALNKIPQIGFSLLIDEYRWRYFEGSLKNINSDFWDLALELQGVAPPGERGEENFDAGAKFHVPDNTPFIRYFLSSFLQHQLFETLCKAAVFGRRNPDEPLPDTIAMNKCDIYGSKTVGKILKDFMSRGNSQHWRDILIAVTGESDISSAPLVRYYRPLFKLLRKIVRAHHIPIGW